MSSLLAILLVVNSTRGHHFLFSYPPNPKRPVGRRNNKVNTDFIVGSILTTRASSENDKTEENIEGGSHSNTNTNSNKAEVDRRSSNASKSTNIHSKHSHNNTDNESKQDEYTGTDTIFQMDVSFLADALAPKSSLCDRKFQLSMDDLTFVGHPVSLSSPHQTQDVESTLHSHSPSPDSTTNHIGALPGNIEEEDDHTAYSSDITSASIHMTLFHVVFVIAPPVLELNAQVETLYQNVILRYSSALRYEQLRCGYVQEEIEKVLALKEEAFNKGTPYVQVMEEILHKSSLARDIKSIYTAISADTPAHVIINDFIDLSLQIPVLGKNNISEYNQQMDSFHSKDVHHGSSLMDIYGASGYEYDNYPVLCPYHTLLLLEDPEEVLKNMPLDASPTLVQLVQILTPTQSLQELHLLLDCSLAQIYRLAAHLIYWRKAKLIHTISTRNIYVVSPTARLNEISSLEADFKLHVPNLSLPVLLSKLSRAQQYHQVYGLKELKNQYLEAITYLIRKDLVVQLHMYLVVLTLVERKQGTETPQSQQDPNTIDTTDNIASSPTTNTLTNDTEWNRLKRSTYERAPKEISDLFDRLKEYMDGQHHIEEIIYREGVSRRQLGLVLKYYRDKIVTVYHY